MKTKLIVKGFKTGKGFDCPKVGTLLNFQEGPLKLVRPDGSFINVIKVDGKVFRQPKLNKKQRIKLRKQNGTTN